MKGRDYKIEEKRKRKGEARLGTKFGEQYLRINLLGQNPRTSFSSKTSCVFLSLSTKSNGWSPNSQKPRFPTQSLQIYCFGLIGSAYPIFLGLGSKLRPYNWRRLWEIWCFSKSNAQHTEAMQQGGVYHFGHGACYAEDCSMGSNIGGF